MERHAPRKLKAQVIRACVGSRSGCSKASPTGLQNCVHYSGHFSSGGWRCLASAGSPPCYVIREITRYMANRETGTVKWFDNAKGYGFIQRNAGEDVFVHFRQIKGEGFRTLQEGQQVEFSIVQGQKGLQAEEVVAL